MISTYHIRLEAIKCNLDSDGDTQRYRNDLSRLEIDVSAALKRCQATGDECIELKDLIEFLSNILKYI